MDGVSYFKSEAKKLLRDFKTQKMDSDGIYAYSPKFFPDIYDIIVSFGIDEDHFTLMQAQHIIAYLAGFEKWSDLIHASDAALELGELLLQYRNHDYGPLHEMWRMYLYSSQLDDVTDESKLEIFKKVFLPQMS